jgi:transaldolase
VGEHRDDVLYVEALIAPGVVNTMPEKTLRAFAGHGDVGRPLGRDRRAAERVLEQAQEAGVELSRITSELEREGVQSFCGSYRELLDCIESKLAALAPDTASRSR